MSESVLEKAAAFIEANPKSAQSLLLYALVSTLTVERGGYLFKLIKLREMDAATRRLAYELMEHMAEGGNTGPEWDAFVERINEAVRGTGPRL